MYRIDEYVVEWGYESSISIRTSRRIGTVIFQRFGITHPGKLPTPSPIAKVVLIPLAIALIAGVWMFVLCWYFIMYVLFGVFFFIFRLFTRSRRKNKRDKLRHREVLGAIDQRKQL